MGQKACTDSRAVSRYGRARLRAGSKESVVEGRPPDRGEEVLAS